MSVVILASNQPSNFAPVLSSSAHAQVRAYIQESTSLCEPQNIHICDGSETENSSLLRLMVQQGTIQALPKYDNW
jgi:phosphoenolpyruvate carboxykinase (GTP)